MKKQTLNQIKEQFVNMSISRGDYIKLPKIISKGNALRVSGYGSLEDDDFEHGFLILPKGSEINYHVHLNNIELYHLIKGDENIQDDICLLGDYHGIKQVNCNTIIEYLKINKKIYQNVNNNRILNGLLQTKLEITYNKLNESLYNIANDIEENDNIELQNIIKSIYFIDKKPKSKKLNK